MTKQLIFSEILIAIREFLPTHSVTSSFCQVIFAAFRNAEKGT